ncbi:MAG: hypothetical protein H6737_24945 [Alphaproteobacteria bacterium]|nr:hypothetical protein [Alphaproteobacteria bacterium]
MRHSLIGILAMGLVGCAARVPVRVPAAPSVQVPTTAIAVIAVDRDCREIADRLADALHDLDGMSVQPDAPTRLNLYACNSAWTPESEGVVEGRSVAIAALTTSDGVAAHLLGAARHIDRAGEGPVRASKRVQAQLDGEVAHDLAEQVAPVSTVVRRRVYADPSNDSARQYHNLAVAAERDGRLDDAVWWARLAWERNPTVRRARYVSELTRRLARTGPVSGGSLSVR